ncbi:ComGF family competence protein [Evansella sp. AB-rgal1]|uniref:ComGF family competence protein n=1 Tax=Evansella sp. AB-rgal1 TaxID=3242696 RepID=UPI00359E98B0
MTLIECLISISIFFLIISMIPNVYSVWRQGEEKKIIYEEKVLFLLQLQLDFRNSTAYWINTNETILYFSRPSDNATVQYELYEDKVRRRVNRTGHEVFLQHVKRIKWKQTVSGLLITLEGIDGYVYEDYLFHPKFVGEIR